MARSLRVRRAGVVLFAVLAVVFSLVSTSANAPAARADSTIQVAATLHLFDLECGDKDDDWGSDEPYININGQRVWEAGNFDNNDIEFLDLRFGFNDTINVQIWEDDGGLTGGDDKMAEWTITAAEIGTGLVRVQTTENQAGWYFLRYAVEAA